MVPALLIVLMLIILFIAFKFFKTKENSTYNDINFNNAFNDVPDEDQNSENKSLPEDDPDKK